MIDEYISAIMKIANHDAIKKHVEPQVMRPQDVTEWQVRRILYAEGLLNQEAGKDEKV